MRGLAGVAALALAVAVAPRAAAQEGAFGSGAAMHGTLESGVTRYTYDGGDREVVVSMDVSLRYKMWRLVGEPVWQFVPRYEIARVQWGDRTIERDASAPNGTVRSPDGGATLIVSPDVFAKIRLRSFWFYAPLRRPPGAGSVVPGVHMETQAAFGNPGEWGWDVPGSPAWKRTFTTMLKPPEAGEPLPEGKWLTADAAQREWRNLTMAWRRGMVTPLVGITIYRPRFDFSAFWTEVDGAAPEVADGFYTRQRPGESDKAFEARRGMERQARAMLRAVERELQWIKSGGVSKPSPKLTRLLTLTKAIVSGSGDMLSPDLSRRLRQAETRLSSGALDARIRALADGLGKWREGNPGADSLPDDLRETFEQLGKDIRAAGDAISSATRARWERLAQLRPGGWIYVFATARRGIANSLFLWGGNVTKEQERRIRKAADEKAERWLERSPRRVKTRVYRVPAWMKSAGALSGWGPDDVGSHFPGGGGFGCGMSATIKSDLRTFETQAEADAAHAAYQAPQVASRDPLTRR